MTNDESDALTMSSSRSQTRVEGEGHLRQPHERDESSDSQSQGVREVMGQAAEDLRRGLKDTSRKDEADRAYEMQKGQGAAGTAPAAPDASGSSPPSKHGG
jgi:hypothetical protein